MLRSALLSASRSTALRSAAEHSALARPVVKAGFVASLRRMAARCAAAYKTADGG